MIQPGLYREYTVGIIPVAVLTVRGFVSILEQGLDHEYNIVCWFLGEAVLLVIDCKSESGDYIVYHDYAWTFINIIVA